MGRKYSQIFMPQAGNWTQQGFASDLTLFYRSKQRVFFLDPGNSRFEASPENETLFGFWKQCQRRGFTGQTG